MAKPSRKAPNPLCLFCCKPGKSREHVFADWLSQLVPRAQNAKHNVFEGGGGSPVSHRLGNGRAVSKKVKAPCTTCNNVWMSKVETAAKPLLLPLMHGSSSALDADQQRIIATWLTIKAMVWDYDQVLRAVLQQDRDDTFQNQAPPKNWRVWLGRCDGEFGESGVFAESRLILRPDYLGSAFPEPTKTVLANTQAFLLYSGAFVGVTVCSPFIAGGAFNDHGGKTLRPLWPVSDKVDWPPVETIQIDGIGLLPQMLVANIRRAVGGL